MKDEYRGKEKGPCVLLHIRDNEVSYTVPDHTGVPEVAWQNNGWELIPLATPPRVRAFTIVDMFTTYMFSFAQLLKNTLDCYEPGTLIPCFQIRLRLTDETKPHSLTQSVKFTGVEPEDSIAITREPEQQGLCM